VTLEAPLHRWVWVVVAVLWLAGATTGIWVLWSYDNAPGERARAVDRWPDDVGLPRDRDRPTLVMLVHPRCTCSRASLGELAEVLARTTPASPKTFVLFLRPDGFADGWEHTDLWHSAAVLPGVTVVLDRGGAKAQRFGAATSGQTFLYDAAGALRFSGGITSARGHAGDNDGRAAVIALLQGEAGGPVRIAKGGQRAVTSTWARVFGCSLFGPGRRSAE
jgi:hypothetical protein